MHIFLIQWEIDTLSVNKLNKNAESIKIHIDGLLKRETRVTCANFSLEDIFVSREHEQWLEIRVQIEFNLYFIRTYIVELIPFEFKLTHQTHTREMHKLT